MGTTLIVAISIVSTRSMASAGTAAFLFWKSMPVLGLDGRVLSKMAVRLVVLPVVTFVITIVTQLIMLLASSAFSVDERSGAAALWKLPWLQLSSGLLHHLVTVHSLTTRRSSAGCC